MKRAAAVLFLGLWTVVAPAAAQPVRKACFPLSEFRGWRAPDNRTIFVRVGFDRVIRLDLSDSCSLLASPGSHLITWTRSSKRVCSPIDWDLLVSQPPDNFPEHCFVTKMRLLLPNEVDLIPSQYRP